MCEFERSNPKTVARNLRALLLSQSKDPVLDLHFASFICKNPLALTMLTAVGTMSRESYLGRYGYQVSTTQSGAVKLLHRGREIWSEAGTTHPSMYTYFKLVDVLWSKLKAAGKVGNYARLLPVVGPMLLKFKNPGLVANFVGIDLDAFKLKMRRILGEQDYDEVMVIAGDDPEMRYDAMLRLVPTLIKKQQPRKKEPNKEETVEFDDWLSNKKAGVVVVEMTAKTAGKHGFESLGDGMYWLPAYEDEFEELGLEKPRGWDEIVRVDLVFEIETPTTSAAVKKSVDEPDIEAWLIDNFGLDFNSDKTLMFGGSDEAAEAWLRAAASKKNWSQGLCTRSEIKLEDLVSETKTRLKKYFPDLQADVFDCLVKGRIATLHGQYQLSKKSRLFVQKSTSKRM